MKKLIGLIGVVAIGIFSWVLYFEKDATDKQSVTLRWNENHPDENVNGYIVEVFEGENPNPLDVIHVKDSEIKLLLVKNRKYSMRVRATNKLGLISEPSTMVFYH